MKASRNKGFILMTVFILVSNLVVAGQVNKPMPPTFSFKHEPEQVLREYPLGLINKQEAFAHHGGPVRKVTLPNGNNGWLYSTGEEAGIPELYIIQFSNDGMVIDVMHKSMHYKNVHSALQYQFLQGVTPKLRMTGPGPGE
ncbi:MAG: hypothetical protein GQ550_05985 [Gammaproteobacteria bacterium]|nr:hypothetical protein [Gammaproteobacteria bacterium]